MQETPLLSQMEQDGTDIILDAMNECFFQLDAIFAFKRINEHTMDFWKLSHLAPIGKDLTTIFSQIEGTTFHNILLQAHTEKINVAQDVIDPVTDRWIHLSISPYADDLIAIFYDIGELIETEVKLKDQSHYLQRIQET
ncbi:MAG TPA: hypothetical protein VGG71_15550, partial [Chitinophagaceae bacterium]